MPKLRLSIFKLALWMIINVQLMNGNSTKGVSLLNQNSKDLRHVSSSSANMIFYQYSSKNSVEKEFIPGIQSTPYRGMKCLHCHVIWD